MVDGYYCEKCRKFVSWVPGEFLHPDLGWRPCFRYARCGETVYPKEQKVR